MPAGPLLVEILIEAGELSPGARGMSFDDAIDQWAEVNDVSLRAKAEALEHAGLPARIPASSVMVGDHINLGGNEYEIVSTALTGSVIMLEYDDPANEEMYQQWSAQENDSVPVTILYNDDRCRDCGRDNTGGEGSTGTAPTITRTETAHDRTASNSTAAWSGRCPGRPPRLLCRASAR